MSEQDKKQKTENRKRKVFRRWIPRQRLVNVLVMVFVLCASFATSAFAVSIPTIDHAANSNFDDILNILFLRDYNTRLVVGSTAILGAAGGMVGSFLLLRKRALISDVLSHAMLPGIGAAFILAVTFGANGKSLPFLLLGALVSGLLGVGCVLFIRAFTRLKDDAALGIVLSVFFGLGIVLLGFAQRMPEGSAAGLQSFIYGKSASIIQSDLLLIGAVALAVVIATLLFFKELTLLCFDEQFAGAIGWRPVLMDVVLMALVAVVTVVGLQSVGLILVIALLIIPATAARFWTDRLRIMIIGATVIGALSGWLGSSISALKPNLPAGAVIVVVCAGFFIVSLLFGPARGAIPRVWLQVRTNSRIARQHVLRAMYEIIESQGDGSVALDPSQLQRTDVGFDELLPERSWSQGHLLRKLRSAIQDGMLTRAGDSRYRLTAQGAIEAIRVVRNHRLWEVFLITHADIAPSHVDRDADMIEHVLGNELVQRLEKRLGEDRDALHVPQSPHRIGGALT